MSATPHRAKASTRTPMMTEATQDLEAARSCWSIAKTKWPRRAADDRERPGMRQDFLKMGAELQGIKHAYVVGGQLEDERTEGRSGRNPGAEAWPGRDAAAGRYPCLSAGHADRGSCASGRRWAGRNRRSGLSSAALGRVYRGYFGGNASRCGCDG